MNTQPSSWSRMLTVLGLLIAAAGITTLFVTSSVAVPPIAIGPILLIAVAALVALAPWRWAPGVGVGLALFILGGAIIAPGLVARMSNPGVPGAFVGTWVQVLGLLIALIAGVITTRRNYQTP